MEAISEAWSKIIVYMQGIVEAGKEQDGVAASAPILIMEFNSVGGREAGFRRACGRGHQRSCCPCLAIQSSANNAAAYFHAVTLTRSNENKMSTSPKTGQAAG